MSQAIDVRTWNPATQTVTAPRATSPTPGQSFRSAMGQVGATALGALERALPFLPGGVGVTTAIRGGAGVAGASSALSSSLGSATTGGASSASPASLAIDQSAQQSLELLALQQRIATEQNQFSTVSNVMKARHDTLKNVIGNVR